MPNNTKKPYIIAEVGVSHEGSVGIAASMINKVAECGADAIKFQMHIAEEESTHFEKFRLKFSFQDKDRYQYWKRTSFKIENWKYLKNHSKKKGLDFICSPFSLKSVKLLKKINVDKWKIASGEASNLILLNEICKSSNREIIISTGLIKEKELDKTIEFIRSKKKKFSLLQCNSEYPTKLQNLNYGAINWLKKKYNCRSGISDHTGNINSLMYAISIGAKILETHVCFSKDFFGPDTSSSITFDDLKKVINFKNDFLRMKNLNKFSFNDSSKRKNEMRVLFQQNLVYKKDFKKNHKIKIDNINFKKFQKGMIGIDVNKILNKKLNKNVRANQLVNIKDFR